MARGVRKSTREKLEEQLSGVSESIGQYRECLKTLEAKQKELEDSLEQENLRELSSLLRENHMSPEDIKQMITEYSTTEQGA